MSRVQKQLDKMELDKDRCFMTNSHKKTTTIEYGHVLPNASSPQLVCFY
jgi:hypothetical protein